MLSVRKYLTKIILPAIVISGWIYVTYFGNAPSAILPKPGLVLKAVQLQYDNGQLMQDVGISTWRVIRGYFWGGLAGVSLGILMGMFRSAKDFFSGVLNAIRQIPMLAWVPMIILWFGIDEPSKTVTIGLGAFFPVLINTQSGIAGTPKAYLELAKIYKLSSLQTFTKVYLCSALPQIFVGLKIGLGTAWMGLVAAELMASTVGMGYRISDARNLLRPDIMIVYMIIIGVLGVFMDKILSAVTRICMPWIKNQRM